MQAKRQVVSPNYGFMDRVCGSLNALSEILNGGTRMEGASKIVAGEVVVE